jgi:hypothetical protein
LVARLSASCFFGGIVRLRPAQGLVVGPEEIDVRARVYGRAWCMYVRSVVTDPGIG